MADTTFDSFAPGDRIRCTITKTPKREDQQQTIARLMREDREIRRNLRRAQERRIREMRYKTRGGRPWAIREHPAKYTPMQPGSTWEVDYVPHLQKDFASVDRFLTLEKA